MNISLSNFIDFVLKTGTTRLTVVKKQVRENGEKYHPAKDFYKLFRESVQEMHSRNLGPVYLDQMVKNSHKRKTGNYRILAKGYKKFASSLHDEVVWHDPPKVDWQAGQAKIRINPEVCLEDPYETLTVKLYTKEEPLRKKHADLLLHLLQLNIETADLADTLAVLDVRRGKLFPATGFNPDLTSLLEAEALAFESIYDKLDGSEKLSNDGEAFSL